MPPPYKLDVIPLFTFIILCNLFRAKFSVFSSQRNLVTSTNYLLSTTCFSQSLFCFFFPVGMPSPSAYTCGAVESVSKKDCFEGKGGKWYASLLKTAARGLKEELLVELVGNEVDVICLTTVYLKFDTHEWGMCGFVNLADSRIAPERRLTYKELQSRFVSGPKDKFAHDFVEAVDFTLESMMDFVRKNFNEFSSSGKLVVVKVLQSFFGVRTVELAFQSTDV